MSEPTPEPEDSLPSTSPDQSESEGAAPQPTTNDAVEEQLQEDQEEAETRYGLEDATPEQIDLMKALGYDV